MRKNGKLMFPPYRKGSYNEIISETLNHIPRTFLFMLNSSSILTWVMLLVFYPGTIGWSSVNLKTTSQSIDKFILFEFIIRKKEAFIFSYLEIIKSYIVIHLFRTHVFLFRSQWSKNYHKCELSVISPVKFNAITVGSIGEVYWCSKPWTLLIVVLVKVCCSSMPIWRRIESIRW